MKVKELITLLLDCEMDADVVVMLEKDKFSKMYKVHNGDMRHTGTYDVTLEPFDDLVLKGD
jgi:hypothetical protein